MKLNFKYDLDYVFDGDKNIVQAEDGRFILFHKNKLQSGLNVLLNQEQLQTWFDDMFKEESKNDFNLLYTGKLFTIEGNFFKSKKGSPFFDLTTENKPHVLIRISWGGPFNKSRGLLNKVEDALYYHRSKTNGGGAGKDYLVIPKDFKAAFSIDDF